MPLAFEGGCARLVGVCGVETAEPLLAWLSEQQAGAVDLSRCRHLHAAVLQVLLAVRPAVEGVPEDAFLRAHVLPLLRPEAGTAPASFGSTSNDSTTVTSEPGDGGEHGKTRIDRG